MLLIPLNFQNKFFKINATPKAALLFYRRAAFVLIYFVYVLTKRNFKKQQFSGKASKHNSNELLYFEQQA